MSLIMTRSDRMDVPSSGNLFSPQARHVRPLNPSKYPLADYLPRSRSLVGSQREPFELPVKAIQRSMPSISFLSMVAMRRRSTVPYSCLRLTLKPLSSSMSGH